MNLIFGNEKFMPVYEAISIRIANGEEPPDPLLLADGFRLAVGLTVGASFRRRYVLILFSSRKILTLIHFFIFFMEPPGRSVKNTD